MPQQQNAQPLNLVCTAHVGDTIEVTHGSPGATSTVEVLAIRGATAYFVIRHAPGGGGLSRIVPPHPSLENTHRRGRVNRRLTPQPKRSGINWELEA